MMEKKLLISLVMPYRNGNRRQSGGDETNYDIFDH